jgi:CHAD domain-containing protein
MKNKEIISIFKLRFKKIEKHYHRLTENFKEEDIHLFRVEIKKLRAFIRLVNSSEVPNEQRIPKSIIKFYHALGNIRNLQLLQDSIKSLSKDLSIENPSGYLQCLHEEENSGKEKASRLAKLNSFKRIKKELIEEAPAELSKQTKETFVQENRSRLAQLLALPFFYDETLHDIRKIIKDLLYNYNYLETSINNLIPSALNNSEVMERLTSLLGDFHDLCVVIYFLGNATNNHLAEPGEEPVLIELRDHLLIRKVNMMDEVIKLLAPIRQQFQNQQSIPQLNHMHGS